MKPIIITINPCLESLILFLAISAFCFFFSGPSSIQSNSEPSGNIGDMGGPFKYKMITPIIFNDKPIIINTVLIFITPNVLNKGLIGRRPSSPA